MLAAVLLVNVILLTVGSVPGWPYGVGCGYHPAGGFGIVLVILLILLLARVSLMAGSRNYLRQFFAYDHLPKPLQPVTGLCRTRLRDGRNATGKPGEDRRAAPVAAGEGLRSARRAVQGRGPAAPPEHFGREWIPRSPPTISTKG
jgi:Protein of unknown function (DUF3309)